MSFFITSLDRRNLMDTIINMICKKCGFSNPEDLYFCGRCGTPLKEIDRDRLNFSLEIIPESLKKRMIEQSYGFKDERRVVSIMFIGIKAEVDRESMEKIFEKFINIVYRYEGYIDKIMGDNMMVLFGAPIAHEDDPLRSVLCAYHIQKEAKKISEEEGIVLKVSIGINRGLCVTGDISIPGSFTVMGKDVNLAQRLQSVAHEGKIYVGEQIKKFTEREVVYRSFKERLKGFEEPVEIYEVLKIVSETLERRRGIFHGREEEKNILISSLEDVKKGENRVILIKGEPGVGKTYLVEEFLKSSYRGRVMKVTGISYLKNDTFFILRNFIRSGLSLLYPEGTMQKKLHLFFKEHEDMKFALLYMKYLLNIRLTPQEMEVIENTESKDLKEMIESAALKMIKYFMDDIIVVFMDDIQWMDLASIQFFIKLMKTAKDVKILMILTAREDTRTDIWNEIKNFKEIKLENFPRDDLMSMIKKTMKVEEIEDALLDFFMERTRGNPFYTHELIQFLKDKGYLYRENGTLRLKGTLEEVPERIYQIILSRFDMLPDEDKEILKKASVLGYEFNVNVLERLEGGEVEKNLRFLTEKNFLEEKDKTDYTFKHITLKDVIYSTLLLRERNYYHGRVAQIIEEMYSDELENFYDVLIYHYREADVMEKYYHYIFLSAERKRKSYELEEAERLYRLLLDAEYELIKVYISLGALYHAMGRYEDSIKYYTKALEFKEELKDREVEVRLGLLNSFLEGAGKEKIFKEMESLEPLMEERKNEIKEHYIRWLFLKGRVEENINGDFEKAITLYRKAEKMARELYGEEHLLVSTSYLRLGGAYVNKGDYDRALDYFNDALSIMKKILPENHIEISGVYDHIARSYYHKGEYDKALEYYRRGLEIRKAILPEKHPFIANFYSNMGVIYNDRGEYDEALEYYKKALNIREEVLPDFHVDIGSSYNNIGLVYLNKGDYEKALDYFQKSLEIWRKALSEDHPDIALSHYNIGNVYFRMKKFDEALRNFEKCLEIRLKVLPENHPFIAVSYNSIGAVYSEKKEYPRALFYTEKSIDILRKSLPPEHPYIAYIESNLGLLYFYLGEYDKALSYYRSSISVFEKIFAKDKSELMNAYMNMGLLLFYMGKYNDAIRYYNMWHDVMKLSSRETSLEEIKYYEYIGRIYLEKGEYEKALYNFGKGVELCNQKKKNVRLLHILIDESIIYYFTGNKEKSYEIFNKVKDKIGEIEDQEVLYRMGELSFLHGDRKLAGVIIDKIKKDLKEWNRIERLYYHKLKSLSSIYGRALIKLSAFYHIKRAMSMAEKLNVEIYMADLYSLYAYLGYRRRYYFNRAKEIYEKYGSLNALNKLNLIYS